MESDLLTAFIDEAESILIALRGCILPVVHDSRSGELGGPLGLVRSLRSTAQMFPMSEFQEALARLEAEVGTAHESRTGLTSTAAGRLLDLLAELEAMLGGLKLTAADPEFDIGSFVEDSFDLLQTPSGPPTGSTPFFPPQTAAACDEFEIDAEMLEVFAMEAEDLLTNIEANLELLAIQANNREALWEIRRNAHTYKGAAGIVGLKQQSELAHRVEDLLDRLSETEAESNREIFELLRSAADYMRSMTSGDSAKEKAAELSHLYTGFDRILRSLSIQRETAPEEEKAIPLHTDRSEPEIAQAKTGNSKNDRRPIVRVSLERLDDLVKNVRDMVISRSVFERRLDDLEQQINELHNSTRRLQITSSKLEIDFEASLLRDPAWAPSVRDNNTKLLPGRAQFDALEFDRYTEFHQSTRELAETASDTFSISTALDAVRGNLENLFDNQRRLINEMQTHLMQIRMVEFNSVTTRLQRTVRVTCEEEEKRAEVTIENGHHEIDTQVLDALIEPLMHLLKNAVVHGIESPETRRLLGKSEHGNIQIRLTSEETHIVLSVTDDGRGISGETLKKKAVGMGLISADAAGNLSPKDELNLIFLPALTTADKISLSAGRGVGMSIVKESIESRKGTIAVMSAPQRGTTFTLRMPLPLAVTSVVLVKANGHDYALPAKQLEHIGTIPSAAVDFDDPNPSIMFSGQNYCFRFLENFTGQPSAHVPGSEYINILLAESGGLRWAIAVDEVVKSEEVVIESLGKPLDSIPGLVGAAILGSGELVPILDLPAMLKSLPKPAALTPKLSGSRTETIVMIVDDSPSVRHMTKKVVENAGWRAETAKDGFEALDKLKSARCLPTIILSDIEMPRMDGYEFVTAVRESTALKHIPIVVITSRSSEKHREKAAAAGVTEYLTKPYDEQALLRLIERFVEKPGP